VAVWSKTAARGVLVLAARLLVALPRDVVREGQDPRSFAVEPAPDAGLTLVARPGVAGHGAQRTKGPQASRDSLPLDY
jgi:hypothetical protein